MTTGAPALEAPRPARSGDRALLLAAALASVPAGLALALTFSQFQLAPALGLAAGVALLLLLALALAHYQAAVGLGLLLLGATLVDPAPSDAVFLVVIAVAAATGRFHLRDAPAAALVGLAMLGALNLISAIEVADVGRAAVFFGITLYLAVFAIWLCGYVVQRERARLVVRAYLVAATISAVIGVAALLAHGPGASLLTESDRSKGLFQDPNVFGAFGIPALLILIDEIVHPRLLRARTSTKLALVAILALGVVFGYSRGAWLNLAIGVVVMGVVLVLRRGGARQARRLIAVTIAATAVAGGAVAATGSATFLAERARPQTYDTERFGGQRAGLRSAEQYPFGAGPGSFESIAGISAHSTYARAVGEQGFPGLVVLLGLLGFTLLAGAGNAARGRSTYGIGSAALLASWCGLLANSLFIDTLHWRHLWLVAALIWAGAMRAQRPRAP